MARHHADDGVPPVVEVRHLRKSYGEKVAVQDVSFAVAPGEIFGILGPNGAGKTTTVEAIAGLRHADSGDVRVLGIDTQAEPDRIRTALGMQLQESALPERITVREAIDLYGSFYPDPMPTEQLIDMLDLRDRAGARYAALSGGQKQRLSIALALVGRPQVAILDELTTGLDPAARRATWDLIETVRDSGVTILLVTHFMDEAERLCDRLVVIDGGRIVAEGSPAELVSGDGELRTIHVRLAEAPSAAVLEALRAAPDVATVTGDGLDLEIRGGRRVLPSAVAALDAAGIVPESLRTGARSLEDVFVGLISHDDTPAQEGAHP
ncbi:ABC transporter related [Beutenbergia cavernae DSM 12333]|uniref:ABC transporter related n=1 Tax=Beutenbergia cavernae (strain ATCC BAA-8 / DSM 12333 / CCUG 43141 / JCM 11478 / NBRC 16432 / NCIMB 13614 / HKI 0122) TaxID=471853 RepID=C5BX70_BEUC1|nr:ABC transporter ATP-binding protein [Beutenbergia cavernae]ACQ78745.1 ABC transporter related [Beutenbergia cavernae DSM 12333]